MAALSFEFEGLDELRAELKQLPADLATEANDDVVKAANDTAAQLKAAYPGGPSGNLRRGVKVTTSVTPTGTVATVISAAPEAHLWEFGTQIRHTQKGFNRGAAPAHYNEGLVGIAEQHRRVLDGQLFDLLVRAGFEVSGSPTS